MLAAVNASKVKKPEGFCTAERPIAIFKIPATTEIGLLGNLYPMYVSGSCVNPKSLNPSPIKCPASFNGIKPDASSAAPAISFKYSLSAVGVDVPAALFPENP